MAQILIIEADHLLAGSLQTFLKAAGHQTTWHVDLQLAMDALDKKKPNLLILDLLLPGRSGTEFLYELRSYPDWQSLPVVVFSSVSEAELGLSAPTALRQLNIANYFYKPQTSLAKLAQAIERILKPVKI
jgi:DNA-binding response OmpR family regulator